LGVRQRAMQTRPLSYDNDADGNQAVQRNPQSRRFLYKSQRASPIDMSRTIDAGPRHYTLAKKAGLWGGKLFVFFNVSPSKMHFKFEVRSGLHGTSLCTRRSARSVSSQPRQVDLLAKV